jgi:hypothetical protein
MDRCLHESLPSGFTRRFIYLTGFGYCAGQSRQTQGAGGCVLGRAKGQSCNAV